MKCGRCWKDGHPGSRCLATGPAPGDIRGQLPKSQVEPLFDKLLTGSLPHRWPEMPKDSPAVVTCFIHRDEEYMNETTNLGQGIVVTAIGWEGDLIADTVASYATATELVELHEISVASLSASSCLIILPPVVAPETFLRAIPSRIWDLGLDFQQWSSYSTANKAVPEYKVLLELRDVPVTLWREHYITQIVSSFGLYLGSISPPHPGDYSAWTVAIATDHLERIPFTIETMVGGIPSKIRTFPIKWIQAPIYKEEDMPARPSEFVHVSANSSPDSPHPSDLNTDDEEDMIHIPRRMVIEMCKGKDLASLPQDIQEYLARIQTGVNSGTAEESPYNQPLGLSIENTTTENSEVNPKEPSPAKN